METTGLAEGAEPSAASPTRTPRDVVVLGSTGSIGTQALDIIRRNPDRFRVAALAAGGGQPDLLARQAAEFGVAAVAVVVAMVIWQPLIEPNKLSAGLPVVCKVPREYVTTAENDMSPTVRLPSVP